MLSKPKSRKVAAILAFSGTLVPVSGLHKFYLGQPLWGVLYLLLSWTPIPRVASAIEGFWYLVQDGEEFDRNFNADPFLGAGLADQSIVTPANFSRKSVPTRKSTVDPQNVNALADALRQLESLRQEGLISEYEFEQKRRQLLN